MECSNRHPERNNKGAGYGLLFLCVHTALETRSYEKQQRFIHLAACPSAGEYAEGQAFRFNLFLPGFESLSQRAKGFPLQSFTRRLHEVSNAC